MRANKYIRGAQAAVVSILAFPLAVLHAQPNRIVSAVDMSRTVVLRGHVHPSAHPRYDLGAVEPSLELGYVTLLLRQSPDQQAALEQLLADQQDPSSPRYHQWLSPEQYGDRFGLSGGDTAQVVSWLRSQGLTVKHVARGHNWIAFGGTAERISGALRIAIHRYRVDGATHVANATEPSIPVALAGVVSGFQGLDDFPAETSMAISRPIALDPAGPNFNSGSAHLLAPDDLATIYGISPLYGTGIDGSDQKIVIVGTSAINLEDVQAFRKRFNLPPNDPQVILAGTDPGTVPGALTEANLDIEWAGAVARYATIIYVYGTNTTVAIQYAIDQNLAPVISRSFGICELQVSSFSALQPIARQANAQGITLVVSSGDSGAGGCDRQGASPQATKGLAVNAYASVPEATGVGGAQFSEGSESYWGSANNANGASALSYIPETVWNENGPRGLAAGGGGRSVLFPKPAWQVGPGVPADNVRAVPDISLSSAGHDAYLVVSQGGLIAVSGTSAATPAFAGIVALLNQYAVSSGAQPRPGLGNINPRLYRLAQTTSDVFHDITSGDNIVPCMQSSPDCATGSFGYSAGPGYDMATGLGSVDAGNLIKQWNSRDNPTTTELTSSAPSVPLGSTMQLTATVKAAAGLPTGTVSFQAGVVTLGSAPLQSSGEAASATLTVFTSQLPGGASTILAVYGGDANFSGSAASITVSAAPPVSGSAVVPAIAPNPVFAQLGTSAWTFAVRLTEVAGVATTLTDYTIDGVSRAQQIPTIFGGSAIPAKGSLMANVTLTGLTVPATVVLGFSGADADGQKWTQQVSVPLYPARLVTLVGISMNPVTVLQDPAADPACQWPQQLNVQERNGFGGQLTRLVLGTTDISTQISQLFGTTRFAPFGLLQAKLCWTGITAPQSNPLALDITDETGGVLRGTLTASFRAAAASVTTLSASPALITLTAADSSQTGSASLGIDFGGSAQQAWAATVFPASRATSWLKVSALSGTGAAQLRLDASGAGLANGVYRATLIVQSPNTTPAYVNVPLVFVVGASPEIAIDSVASGGPLGSAFARKSGSMAPDGFFAPGMVMAVFGSGLASSTRSGVSPPLRLLTDGVSVTVNGVSAPLYYVSPDQINIQVPYETGAGTAALGINNNGRVAYYTFDVKASAPAIFTGPDGALLPVASGKPGQSMTLLITGDGDVSPALANGATPAPGTAPTRLPKPRLPVAVTVGGAPAASQVIGIPSGFAGQTQIGFTIPLDAAPGVQPVVVTVGDVASAPANITVMAQ